MTHLNQSESLTYKHMALNQSGASHFNQSEHTMLFWNQPNAFVQVMMMIIMIMDSVHDDDEILRFDSAST